MAKNVQLLYEARMELRDIAAFRFQKVGAASARSITDSILNALDLLADFPEMGYVPPYKMLAESGYRVLGVKDYLCFYRIAGEDVFVVHIVHGSTDYIKKLFK